MLVPFTGSCALTCIAKLKQPPIHQSRKAFDQTESRKNVSISLSSHVNYTTHPLFSCLNFKSKTKWKLSALYLRNGINHTIFATNCLLPASASVVDAIVAVRNYLGGLEIFFIIKKWQSCSIHNKNLQYSTPPELQSLSLIVKITTRV